MTTTTFAFGCVPQIIDSVRISWYSGWNKNSKNGRCWRTGLAAHFKGAPLSPYIQYISASPSCAGSYFYILRKRYLLKRYGVAPSKTHEQGISITFSLYFIQFLRLNAIVASLYVKRVISSLNILG